MTEKKSIKTVIVSLAVSTLIQSALAAQVPADHSYSEHIPSLHAFSQAMKDENTNKDEDEKKTNEPQEPYAPEKTIDKNPITGIPVAFGRVLVAFFDLSRIGRKEYWKKLNQTFNAAVAHTVGVVGDTAEDIEHSIAVHKAHRAGFVANPSILQCTSALPLKGFKILGGISAATQLKHTWLQVDGQSYGMPYTLNHTYFGGDAVITSPDGFQNPALQSVACEPVMQPNTEDSIKFENRFKCIAEKASTKWIGERTRELVLDYNALDENCMAAVRFVTECSGGRISQIPNLAVGDQFGPSNPAKFRYKDEAIIAQYDEINTLIVDLDESLAQDKAANPELTIEQFIKAHSRKLKAFHNLLLKTADFVDSNYPDRIMKDFRYTNGTIRQHWLRYVVSIWDNQLSHAKKFASIGGPLVLILQNEAQDYPSVYATTIQDACETLRSECDAPQPANIPGSIDDSDPNLRVYN